MGKYMSIMGNTGFFTMVFYDCDIMGFSCVGWCGLHGGWRIYYDHGLSENAGIQGGKHPQPTWHFQLIDFLPRLRQLLEESLQLVRDINGLSSLNNYVPLNVPTIVQLVCNDFPSNGPGDLTTTIKVKCQSCLVHGCVHRDPMIHEAIAPFWSFWISLKAIKFLKLHHRETTYPLAISHSYGK